MDKQHSQFNDSSDGHNSTYRVAIPWGFAGGSLAFMLANGVTVNAASADSSGVTLTLTVLGAVATAALGMLTRWIVK